LDIAILVDRTTLETVSNTIEYQAYLVIELQSLFLEENIDLVLLNNTPPLLANQVVSKGKLLYFRNTRICNEYIVNTKKRYIDTRPLREIKRKYM